MKKLLALLLLFVYSGVVFCADGSRKRGPSDGLVGPAYQRTRIGGSQPNAFEAIGGVFHALENLLNRSEVDVPTFVEAGERIAAAQRDVNHVLGLIGCRRCAIGQLDDVAGAESPGYAGVGSPLEDSSGEVSSSDESSGSFADESAGSGSPCSASSAFSRYRRQETPEDPLPAGCFTIDRTGDPSLLQRDTSEGLTSGGGVCPFVLCVPEGERKFPELLIPTPRRGVTSPLCADGVDGPPHEGESSLLGAVSPLRGAESPPLTLWD